MFSKACKIGIEFTFPLIISYRLYSGEVKSIMGSYVIINESGWLITAAHLIRPFFLTQIHQDEMRKLKADMEYIREKSPCPDCSETRMKIDKLKRMRENKNWITNISFWWGKDNFKVEKFIVNFEIDIAIGKIQNYNPMIVKNYPLFKKPVNLKIGTSLCKLGYPFSNIKTYFNPEKKSFTIDPGIFPLQRFPLDGIFTREISLGKTKDQQYEKKYIETSTPGLMGQSGGPILDKHGNIWAIQSQTLNIPLGFAPKIKYKDKEIIENQFINVGLGIHPQVIFKFLHNNRIEFFSTEN